MREVPCECCGRLTTGEIRYCPMAGGQYVMCPQCSWQCGNFADMVRLSKPSRIPTYEECMKKMRRSTIEVKAVLPKNQKQYMDLKKFYIKTHPSEKLG